MGNRSWVDSRGVRRGKRGGVSPYNQNWKAYYGETVYNAFIQNEREKWKKQSEEHQKEQDQIPLKPLAKEDCNLKRRYGFIFDHYLIGKMDGAKYRMFLENLNEEEQDIYYREDTAIEDMEHKRYIENGEIEEEPPWDDIDFDY